MFSTSLLVLFLLSFHYKFCIVLFSAYSAALYYFPHQSCPILVHSLPNVYAFLGRIDTQIISNLPSPASGVVRLPGPQSIHRLINVSIVNVPITQLQPEFVGKLAVGACIGGQYKH